MRIFEGYNPRDLRKTLLLVGADIVKIESRGESVPAILRKVEMEINRELARISV